MNKFNKLIVDESGAVIVEAAISFIAFIAIFALCVICMNFTFKTATAEVIVNEAARRISVFDFNDCDPGPLVSPCSPLEAKNKAEDVITEVAEKYSLNLTDLEVNLVTPGDLPTNLGEIDATNNLGFFGLPNQLFAVRITGPTASFFGHSLLSLDSYALSRVEPKF